MTRRLLLALCTAALAFVTVAAQTVDLQQTIPFDARGAHRARCRTASPTSSARTADRPSGSRCGSRSRPARSSRTTDQQGLAHLIEHMAFNGSAHFKPGELVSYFESIGARLGPHVNAYTSFDETVYMLDLPTDQAGDHRRRRLTALADFAGGLTFDPDEMDKERGVVIEEWRGGLGAGSRIRDKQMPVLFHDSRYADRLPIGKPDILRTAPVGAAARLLRHVVSARADGGHRGRRLRPAQIEQTITTMFAPLAGARAGGAAARSQRAAPRPDAGQRRRRPGSDAIERADRAQARAARASGKSATTAATCRAHRRSHDRRALWRARAETRRQISRRRRRQTAR